ncbi:DUF1572 domain-containing protein [Marinoscillum sp. MHG1-6]|uniref:DUF1572 domain-containing protein n=1 Tax=Marinoscillum sp. MHG1-6 TaxID=2959627 RepID=UPI002158125B|nr:DUF1572 domain-containing protein [Marinoscillum sp. MHG1-6]
MNGTLYLENTIKLAQYYKKLGNSTLEQLTEDDIHWTPGPTSNSIAIIVKHLWGNMLSRWTNFMTEDGEKTWRQRDEEFEDDIQNMDELMSKWEEGWTCFLKALKSLRTEDMDHVIYIRNEGHSVADAIQRQMAHYPMHIGQMIYIAKLLKGDDWQTLSIPKGQSQAYNEKKFSEEKEDRHFTDQV